MGDWRMLGQSCDILAFHPEKGEVEILLIASCEGNRDKLRPDGSLGSGHPPPKKISTLG